MSKIPEKAKRVFKGVIFDVYQWEQVLFDGSKTTFEMIKRPNTLAVIASISDKILVTVEEQPSMPKEIGIVTGRQEENEHPLQGAKREFLEETGMVSDNWTLFKKVSYHYKIEWETYIFLAKDCRKIKEPKLDAGEKIELKYVSFNEFLEDFSNENIHFTELSNMLFRIKNDPIKKEEFRKLLFD